LGGAVSALARAARLPSSPIGLRTLLGFRCALALPFVRELRRRAALKAQQTAAEARPSSPAKPKPRRIQLRAQLLQQFIRAADA